MNKKICFITGSRAEYGLLKPIMEEIRKGEFELKLIVTGMHLSPQFGMTIDDIYRDGFKADIKVEMTPKTDSQEAMAESVGVGIIGLTKALGNIKPDLVLILGDRVEVLAGAIASSYSNIPVAHIHGGDSAKAGLDENTRHAITKISHIHFPASKISAERILRMGEENWRIHVIGAPGLDDISAGKFTSKDVLMKKYQLDQERPIIMLVQHPVTTQVDQASAQIINTLEAVVSFGYQSIIIYPNSDAGSRNIITIIEEYLRKYSFLKGYKSISRPDYLGLLSIVSVLVGNSSSGIIESSSFQLPVVDIGIRQEGREQSLNIIHADHEALAIEESISKSLSDRAFLEKVKLCKNPYWYGGAGKKVARVLSDLEINDKLLQKKITY